MAEVPQAGAHGVSRVLVFSPDYKPSGGGVAEHAFKIARAMMRKGLHVVVLAPRQRGGREFDARAGIPTYRVPRAGPVTGILFFSALLSIVRRHGIDFVYCATSHPSGLICAAASVFAGFRHSVTIHGHEVMYARRGLRQTLKSILRPLQVAVLNASDRVFAVSAFTRDSAVKAGVKQEKIHVIYNGIDMEDFREPADVKSLPAERGVTGGPLVVTVGRLVERKGHDVVIKAMPDILDRAPGAAYVIVGDGPERARLARLAADTGVGGHVHLMGSLPRRDVLAFIAACDVFVMPSRRVGTSVEGFGIVFLEAGALKKPVVGGRSGGIPDAVEDGVTGLLVDPSSPEETARAVTRILTDSDLARRLGEAGYERVTRLFTWDKVADRILEGMADA